MKIFVFCCGLVVISQKSAGEPMWKCSKGGMGHLAAVSGGVQTTRVQTEEKS